MIGPDSKNSESQRTFSLLNFEICWPIGSLGRDRRVRLQGCRREQGCWQRLWKGEGFDEHGGCKDRRDLRHTTDIDDRGLESLLHDSGDMQVVGSATSIFNGLEMVQNQAPAIVLIDKAFGLPAVMDWLADLRSTDTRSVVWGVSLSRRPKLCA